MCNLKEKIVKVVIERAEFRDAVIRIVEECLQTLKATTCEVIEETPAEVVKAEPKKKRHYNRRKKEVK